MVKKIIILVIVILLFTIYGDANPDFIQNHSIYAGESPSWTAVWAADETGVFLLDQKGLHYNSWSNDLLTVTYKKDPAGLNSIKYIKIEYQPDTNIFSGSLSENYSDGDGAQKVYRLKSGSKGGMLLKEDTVFTVTVTTDKTVETMYLYNPAIN